MNGRALGLSLVVIGVLVSQYGWLHDLVWAKHAGAIYMGMRTYLVVAVGLATVGGGCLLLWRSSQD